MEWSVPDIFKIINLYRQYTCLWEYRSPDYKRVDLKRNAWEEISKEMCKSVEEVKKKIKYLRSAYVGEKKKADESKTSGSATDDVYRPHLFYFSEFNFLDSVIIMRKTTSNLPKESCETLEVTPEQFECQQDSQESFSIDTDSTSTPVGDKKYRGIKRSRAERDNKFNDALDAIITRMSDESDDTMFTCFSKSVGIQLAQLPLFVATSTMAEIQLLLAEKIKTHSRRNIEEAM